MTYFADLGPCDYFGIIDTPLIAVGWLDDVHPYAKGRPSREFFTALARLLVNPWQPFVSAGIHHCELCVFTGGPGSVRFDNTDIGVGHLNLFVPSTHGLFVAPSTIVHYIDAHGYEPPAVFQQAVLDCPEMRSITYLKALQAQGAMRRKHRD